LKKAEDNNIDAHIFLQMLTHSVRNILLIRFSPDVAKSLQSDLGDDEYAFLSNIAKEKNMISAATLEKFLSAYREMNNAYLKYTPLELAIFNIIGNND